MPELREIDAAKLLRPPQAGMRIAKNYPTPMVDHARERDVTLKMFASLCLCLTRLDA